MSNDVRVLLQRVQPGPHGAHGRVALDAGAALRWDARDPQVAFLDGAVIVATGVVLGGAA